MKIQQEAVLSGWSDYEKRKARSGADPALFSCDDAWEIFYLKEKILGAYPKCGKLSVLEAIADCSRSHAAPIPRHAFVQQVMQHLNLW